MAQPPSAASVLASAEAAAAAQHKAVFLIFHASWCGWCHKLDAYLEAPANKAIVDRYFVQARLDVQEHGEQQKLENPGGGATMERVAGGQAGLPYFAFLNEKGGTIVNSTRPGDSAAKTENIGFPDKPYEIDWFLKMIRMAAPAMTAAEAQVLEDSLRGKH